MRNFSEVVGFWPFLEVRKNFKLLEHKHIIYHFEAGDLEMESVLCMFYLLSVLANRESLEHSTYLSQSGSKRGRPVRI